MRPRPTPRPTRRSTPRPARRSTRRSARPALRLLAAGATVTLVTLAGCSSDGDGASADAAATTSGAPDASAAAADDTSTTTDAATANTTTVADEADAEGADGAASGDVFDGAIHAFDVTVDQADVDAAIEDFRASGDKTWIEASVTIDGVTYDQVGMRLKGNSSLMSLLGGGRGRTDGAGGGGGAGGPMGLECATTDATDATDAIGDTASSAPAAPADDATAASVASEDLPWLIRLDEYVDDQQHQGRTDFVVRSNTTETAMNEAVALTLLEEAGLASQDSAHVRFSVNGSDATLRLVVELPDDTWTEEELGDGVLFQADAQGDYRYRGDDPAAYTEAWDHEAGEEDYQPLIEFLDFVNNSTDEEFAAGLRDRLDVESFARYLAFEDLIGNWDDIAGPGNNSYLYFDTDGRATVVAWDHNLALNGGAGPGGVGGPGGMNGMPGGGGGMPGGGTLPDGVTLPDGAMPGGGAFPLPEGCLPSDLGPLPDGTGPGDVVAGPMGRSNVLVDRFLAVDEFQAMYDDAMADLRVDLIDSGFAADTIDAQAALLRDDASDVIDADVVDDEAAVIREALGLS